MENPIQTTSRGPAHPLLIAAAIAVILFCTVGIAAIMGWIPASTGGNAPGVPRTADPLLVADAPDGAPAVPVSDLPPSALVQQSSPRQLAEAPRRAAQDARTDPAPRVVERRRVAAAEPASSWCSNCGNVESVRKITTRARGSGVGAAGGAVLGGLLGNQIGDGSGRQIATVAGAVGGAVIGNQVEGNMKATTRYEVRVRLDDGSVRTFMRDTAPSLRNGERVRIVNGGLRPID